VRKAFLCIIASFAAATTGTSGFGLKPDNLFNKLIASCCSSLGSSYYGGILSFITAKASTLSTSILVIWDFRLTVMSIK